MRGGQADRGALSVTPLAQRQGRRSLGRGSLLVLAVLAAAVLGGLLLVTRSPERSAPPATPRVVGYPVPGPMSDVPNAPAPAAAAVARAFFRGYLAYLYGQAGGSQVRDASPQLMALLTRGRPSVTAATRSRHPVVVALGAHEPGGNVLHVTAMISDGLSRYPIRIVMVHGPRGWETSQVVSQE